MSTASAFDTRRIGWIGLSKMGLPISERLAAQGLEVATLTPNPEGRDRATRANLQSESKIGDVVACDDIVVSAVSDDAALLDIVFQAGGLKETLHAWQIFVEISTVSPSASRRVAEAISAVGVGHIRSLVSGSTALAAQGALTAVISGPAGALASLKDFYAVFTRKTFVVGEGEEARYLKLVLNSLVGGTSALLAEAMAMGRNGGSAMLR
jgi:3-hydroxyisobutyrate dehydrogenase-like beta-hydroxyacid dehydrogenase